jgi:hypothetical protein
MPYTAANTIYAVAIIASHSRSPTLAYSLLI